jgi:uncharacterized membrane protein YqgA involved in biofilm formation
MTGASGLSGLLEAAGGLLIVGAGLAMWQLRRRRNAAAGLDTD